MFCSLIEDANFVGILSYCLGHKLQNYILEIEMTYISKATNEINIYTNILPKVYRPCKNSYRLGVRWQTFKNVNSVKTLLGK